MPISAFVLIRVTPGKDRAVAEAASKVKGVECAHVVVGPYDVVACVEVPDLAALSKTVIEGIRSIPDVKETITLVAL